MSPSDRFCRTCILFLVLCPLATALPLSAAMDSRFELDPKALGVTEPSIKRAKASKPSYKMSRKGKPSGTGATDNSAYTVRAGDNLFKILMRDYGFSNDEAEAFIEVICRENNISDIRRLKVGKKIFIPASWHVAERSGADTEPLPGKRAMQRSAGMKLSLEPPLASSPELEESARIRKTWDRILPPLSGRQKADIISSAKYSLTLDPQRYPVYSAMDGGRILADLNGSIPPLVKTLIVENNPSVRIVSESPANAKRFLSLMLDAAGFYSVEEDFSMDFGSDPRLTVYSDFKIEKSPESLVNMDLILMNSGRTSNPRVLNEFLKKEGFTVHEPFASFKPAAVAADKQLFQINSHNQTEIVDSLLSSLAIIPSKDKRLDVFAADNNGISLSVKVERFFERGGQSHIITLFDGDPVTYTLYRILEAKGYQTVILESQDDFRRISEKLFSRMQIQATYAQHELAPETGQNYSLQMSGLMLEGTGLPADGIFLTSLAIDRLFRELLQESGYRITAK